MIRIKQTDDLELIHELDRECFNAYTPKIQDDDLGRTDWFVAERDGVPVAYCGVRPIPSQHRSYIHRVGVLPEARGMGLQKRLIRRCTLHSVKAGIPRLYTYVKASNLASLRSFISCGWKPYHVETCDIGTIIYLENLRAV
jgi:ribosomal protein S18 acetylase RimI-like enzyme